MERLQERLKLTQQALLALEEVLNMPYSKIVRDAAIQRFEFTLEAIWKLAQRYLNIVEGLDIGSPKGVFRACFEVHLLNEAETHTALQAVLDRNLTVHTYNEELAMQIYHRLPAYLPVLQTVYTAITKKDLLK